MLISMQSVINNCQPCIIEANSIEKIYIKTYTHSHSEHIERWLVLKQYDNDETIQLQQMGYSTEFTKEQMEKAAFAIQAAKSE